MILLIGGTGYVGSHLLARLRQRDEPVRVLARDASKYRHLDGNGVSVVQGDITDGASLRSAMEGVDSVINLVAILRERPGGITFERINYGGTVNVVDAAKSAGVRHVIQQSALGVRPDPALPYFDTKYRAEEYLRQSGLPYTILRPSVIFGEGDEFVNKLADLIRRPLFILPAPIVPVVGDGSTPFSPVFVGDFAEAIVGILESPSTVGQMYELGGPRVISYERMMDELMDMLQIRRWKLHLPVALMKLPVMLMDRLLPNPPVATEQLKMLALDNSTTSTALADLARRPLIDFRDGTHYITVPLVEQRRRVRALAMGEASPRK